MSTAAMTNRLELSSVADSTLKAAARLWFVLAVIGQLAFAFAVSSLLWCGRPANWECPQCGETAPLRHGFRFPILPVRVLLHARLHDVKAVCRTEAAAAAHRSGVGHIATGGNML